MGEGLPTASLMLESYLLNLILCCTRVERIIVLQEFHSGGLKSFNWVLLQSSVTEAVIQIHRTPPLDCQQFSSSLQGALMSRCTAKGSSPVFDLLHLMLTARAEQITGSYHLLSCGLRHKHATKDTYLNRELRGWGWDPCTGQWGFFQLGFSLGLQILLFPSLIFSFFYTMGRQEIYIKWVLRPPATRTLKLELALLLQSALYAIVRIQICFVSKRIHKEKGTAPIPPPLKQYRGHYRRQ